MGAVKSVSGLALLVCRMKTYSFLPSRNAELGAEGGRSAVVFDGFIEVSVGFVEEDWTTALYWQAQKRAKSRPW